MQKYIFPFLLGFILFSLVTMLTLSMAYWAPSAYGWIESVGDFQLRPWIFFAPAIALLAILTMVFQRLRSFGEFFALLAGAISSGGFGLAIFLILMTHFYALPSMRY
jgi:hypothetical protein